MSAPAVDAFLPLDASGGDEARALASGCRAYLDAVRAHLDAAAPRLASGSARNSANADAYDRLIRRLYQRIEAHHYREGFALGERVALLAVGGYARREMSVGSDVDLLFLVEGAAGPLGVRLAERIQLGLWDAGAKVGAAVRDVAQCLALAREDSSALTALLGARFLAGDAELFHALSRAVRERLIPDPARFVAEQRRAMALRHERFGESLYLLQPDLKEGAGGLRDYHTALWVTRAADAQVREPADWLHAGLLSESELRELQEALDFLWQVRNQLHRISGRRADRLTFELQEQLARDFGHSGDADGELPVERFMRGYYRAARTVQALSEIVIEQCAARVRPQAGGALRRLGARVVRGARGAAEVRELGGGFRIAGGQLEIAHAAALRERPLRLLEAFAVAQLHAVPLAYSARRLLRGQRGLVDDAFRNSAEAAQLFMGILDAPHRVTRSLMAMNETGLLGRYLPEWAHIEGRWQHVIYHTYTVDVHSIFLVEQLRRLLRGKFAEELPDLTELARALPDFPALLLGGMLHDIGKGRGGDHSSAGANLARNCTQRLGLSEERAQRVIFIVRNHLLMSHIAQRRDLSDPKVIAEFAAAVGDRENLHNLYLVTFADMRASSESAWTDWRRELLRELFLRCAEFLEAGAEAPQQQAQRSEARAAQRSQAALAALRQRGADAVRAAEFLEDMPPRYFLSHAARQISRHAEAVLALSPEQPLVTQVRELRSGVSELIVCARDRHGLYGDVAGSITSAGINILGSHVYTTRGGIALEIYRVNTPDGGEADRRERWLRFTRNLENVLAGTADLHALLQAQRRPLGQRSIPGPVPASVSVRNDVSDFYTVIDVTADDRLGLLYDLARTMAEKGLAISVSKATTVLDQIADTFYVTTAQGGRVAPGEVAALQRALLAAALGSPDG